MKQFLSMLFLGMLLILVSGCAAEPAHPEESLIGQFEDALGYTVTVHTADHVAAIGGSNAETWLLAGGKLTALTEDAYSERGIEPSAEVINLGTVKSPDVETMILSGIDFAILNAKIAEHVALRSTLENAGITTAYFSIETFEDYLAMLKICTDITGHPE